MSRRRADLPSHSARRVRTRSDGTGDRRERLVQSSFRGPPPQFRQPSLPGGFPPGSSNRLTHPPREDRNTTIGYGQFLELLRGAKCGCGRIRADRLHAYGDPVEGGVPAQLVEVPLARHVVHAGAGMPRRNRRIRHSGDPTHAAGWQHQHHRRGDLDRNHDPPSIGLDPRPVSGRQPKTTRVVGMHLQREASGPRTSDRCCASTSCCWYWRLPINQTAARIAICLGSELRACRIRTRRVRCRCTDPPIPRGQAAGSSGRGQTMRRPQVLRGQAMDRPQ